MYWLLLNLLGVTAISEDFAQLGKVMTLVLLILGNLVFFLLDKALGKQIKRR